MADKLAPHRWSYATWFQRIATATRCIATCGARDMSGMQRGVACVVSRGNGVNKFSNASNASNAHTRRQRPPLHAQIARGQKKTQPHRPRKAPAGPSDPRNKSPRTPTRNLRRARAYARAPPASNNMTGPKKRHVNLKIIFCALMYNLSFPSQHGYFCVSKLQSSTTRARARAIG